jgi:radical SAM superfamily enzyme YgiQ (UPF0313 family)
MKLYKNKGNYLRQFSPKRYIQELKLSYEKFKMKRVLFVDDVFTSSAPWLEEFINKYNQEINLPFGCLVHPSFVNEKIVTLLKRGGCTVVGMGIQTLNQDIRRNIIKRPENKETVEKAILLFKQAGILIYVDLIFGLPKEKEEDAKQAALLLRKTTHDAVSTLWLRYYPQAEIINIAKENNLLTSQDIDTIKQSLKPAPASSFGNAKSNIDKKLSALVLFSVNLPISLVKFILKYKLYKILPAQNLHHLHTAFKQIFNKVIKRKEGALYSSLSVHFKYYLTYIRRYLLK